jgi:hypothetical protein
VLEKDFVSQNIIIILVIW